MNGSKVPGAKFVFDTCAAVFLLDNDERMLSIQQEWENMEKYVSVINRMELRAKPGITESEVQKIKTFLAYTTVIPLNEAVEGIAVKIRSETKIKLPDCIVAATAVVLNAILLTDDPHLKRLSWPGYTVQAI
jgi:predicted nucleic acid-binding protein